jgi:hypothetical protein
MDISSIELLFVLLACAEIAFAQYKKANDQMNRMAEKYFEEITYLDIIRSEFGT